MQIRRVFTGGGMGGLEDWLASLQIMENDANLLLPSSIQMWKGFQLQRDFAALLTRDSASGPHGGSAARPPL